MNDVYIASQDQEPWCNLCGESVPAVIEVSEKLYACADCLRDLTETLHCATGRSHWSTDWPTEPGHYWAWVQWRRAEQWQQIVLEVKQIGGGPLYLTSGAIISKGADFSHSTFTKALFCRIPDAPPPPPLDNETTP